MTQDCPRQNYGSCFEVCLNMTNYKVRRVLAVPLQSFCSEYNLNINKSGGALRLKTCSEVFNLE